MKKNIILAAALALAGVQTAEAGGFMIGEMGARATGMGNAFTAVADDASAAWYNPAGIAFDGAGAQIQLGAAGIGALPVKYTPNAASVPTARATQTFNKRFFIPNGYFTYWDEDSKLGATISVNSPFGLETEWNAAGWLGQSNTLSKINTVTINPSVVFKVSDHFAVAGGFNYTYLTKINLDNIFQRMEAKNKDGWGGTASVMYKNDQFSAGVTYRSRVQIDINGGTVTGGTGLPALAPAVLAAQGLPAAALPLVQAQLAALAGATGSGNTQITLPDQISVGLAWNATPDLLLSLDIDWVNWKTFKEIRIVYAPSALAAVVAPTGTNVIPEQWRDTVVIRAGAEWHYNEQMRARFGYVFDPTPIKDVNFSPAIPGNDRHIFSVGYGYDFTPDTTVDLAYAYVHIMNRSQTLSTGTNIVRNGNYKSSAHIAMGSLNHRF